jgi:hypothetical protein
LTHKGWRDRSEEFRIAVLEPDTEGELTEEETIAAYIDRQGAAPYLEASWKYFDFFCAAEAQLGQSRPRSTTELKEAAILGGKLFDMDIAVARRCETLGIDEPSALEERVDLHIAALLEALADAVEEIK